MRGRPPRQATVPLLFALSASAGQGRRLAGALGAALAPREERALEDGGHEARPPVGVRGRHMPVLRPPAGDARQGVNDRPCRLPLFRGRAASAALRGGRRPPRPGRPGDAAWQAAELGRETDEAVVLAAPSDFRAVGSFHDDSRQVDDAGVTRPLDEAGR